MRGIKDVPCVTHLYHLHTRHSPTTNTVALQYHECKLNITMESAANMAANGIDTDEQPTAELYATFIYLDSSERKRFSQVC